jgi:hypothetical protein
MRRNLPPFSVQTSGWKQEYRPLFSSQENPAGMPGNQYMKIMVSIFTARYT